MAPDTSATTNIPSAGVSAAATSADDATSTPAAGIPAAVVPATAILAATTGLAASECTGGNQTHAIDTGTSTTSQLGRDSKRGCGRRSDICTARIPGWVGSRRKRRRSYIAGPVANTTRRLGPSKTRRGGDESHTTRCTARISGWLGSRRKHILGPTINWAEGIPPTANGQVGDRKQPGNRVPSTATDRLGVNTVGGATVATTDNRDTRAYIPSVDGPTRAMGTCPDTCTVQLGTAGGGDNPKSDTTRGAIRNVSAFAAIVGVQPQWAVSTRNTLRAHSQGFATGTRQSISFDGCTKTGPGLHV